MELSNAEQEMLEGVAFMQLLSAGVDHLNLARIPAGLVVTSNVGAYARPMAEHALADGACFNKAPLYPP